MISCGQAVPVAPGDGLLCSSRDQHSGDVGVQPTAATRGARGDSRLRARPRAIPVGHLVVPDLLVAPMMPVSLSILYEGAWGLSDAPGSAPF